MPWLLAALLTVHALALMALGLTPRRRAEALAPRLGWWTTMLAGSSLLVSMVAAVPVTAGGPLDVTFLRWTSPFPGCWGVYVDAITVVMMTLISFIGMILTRYSLRYLQGDPGRGRFCCWLSFTLGSTLTLVMSCNLVMFTAAWMLTSFGLHQLLMHDPERTWAVWAARKKFLISRLGDAMLVAALVLAYSCFGTTEYTELFAAADAIHAGAAPANLATAWMGILFVLGAMTKSAQFPFHSWLPDTMETPTPVSALMHAGVINAGGFLIIRLSPLVTLSPFALELLALVGAITALVGSVSMLTQTSIKRSLAYSTIAQMGFMMLQCGLGAFSAALLHIVAHSAYKAHAFLSCGSVLDAATSMRAPAGPGCSGGRRAAALAGSIVLAAAIAFGTFQAIGIDVLIKPGGVVFGLILTLALTQLLWNGFATGSLGVALRSLARGLLVAVAYSLAYLAVDRLVAGSLAHHTVQPSSLNVFVLGVVAVGFLGVFLLQALSEPLAQHRWVQALYVHAMNGFYVDIPARRLTAWFYRQAAPVP